MQMKRFTTDKPQDMNEEMFNLCRAGEEGAQIAVGDDGELIDLAEYAASIAHEFGNGCAPTRDDMFEGDYCMGCNYCPAGVLNLLGAMFALQRELLKRFEDLVSNEHGEYDFEEIEKAWEVWQGDDAAQPVIAHYKAMSGDGYWNGEIIWDTWECSNCGEEFESEEVPPDYKYCPNCGAKMEDEKC